MSSPAVTVLLAVHNGGELLRASIESVLAQTFTDWELLVVNDGSTDQTLAILDEYHDPRLRVVTNPENVGLTRSLNRGVREARGALIARQDADDLSGRTRLQKQVAFLKAHRDVQLLGSSAWRLNPTGRITGSNDLPTTHDAIRWASIVDCPFLHTSVMFRRETVLREFGAYDEQFSISQDYDLWNRIAARGAVANLSERLVSMREHPRSMTRTRSEATNEEIARILEANWKALFPARVFSEEEKRLLRLFRQRFPAEELPRLRAVLARLLRDFLTRHPQAAESRDFQATLCRQAMRLAYKFLSSDPAVALKELARAFLLSPMECVAQAAVMTRCRLGIPPRADGGGRP